MGRKKLDPSNIDPETIPDSHKQFINNVIAGHGPTEAYQLAFPTASKATAKGKSSVLKKRYAYLITNRLGFNQSLDQVTNKTIENLFLVAFADVGMAFDPATGKPLPIPALPRGLRMAITEFEVRGNTTKYKLDGRVRALEILSKAANLHSDAPKIQINVMREEDRDRQVAEIIQVGLDRALQNGGDEPDGEG